MTSTIPLSAHRGARRGLEADLATLRNPRARVEWDELAIVADRVGGLEAYRDLLAGPETPVLFISGYADSSAVGIPPGAPLMLKPFGVAELSERVNRLLSSSR